MKTIKQIADELGVSKQAVFYRMKRPPLSNALQSLTEKIDGILMVSLDGEMLIKSAFEKEEPSNGTVKQFDDVTAHLIAALQGQVVTLTAQNQNLQEELSKEREHSRVQADKIAELAENAQRLHAGTMSKQLPPTAAASGEPEPIETAPIGAAQPPKRGLLSRFSRLFGS